MGPGPFPAPTIAEVAEVLSDRQLASNVTPEWIAGRIVKYGVDLSVLRKLFDKGLIKGAVTQQAINGLFKREQNRQKPPQTSADPKSAAKVTKTEQKQVKKLLTRDDINFEEFDTWRKLQEDCGDYEQVSSKGY